MSRPLLDVPGSELRDMISLANQPDIRRDLAFDLIAEIESLRAEAAMLKHQITHLSGAVDRAKMSEHETQKMLEACESKLRRIRRLRIAEHLEL